jgi:hypothetical protein
MGDNRGFASMTTVSSFRAAGPDGRVWEFVIGETGGLHLFRDDVEVSGFLPPRELTEDRIRSALMYAGVGGATAERIAAQVLAE